MTLEILGKNLQHSSFVATASCFTDRLYRLAYNSTQLCMPSTVIDSFTYDPEIMCLTVTFVSGLVYQYLDVPGKVYEQMKRSGSKGVFLNKHIKGIYEYRRLNTKQSS